MFVTAFFIESTIRRMRCGWRPSAARLDQGRRPADLLRVRASQLHAEERLAFELPDQGELALAALRQPARHRHLADRDARAQLDAPLAIRAVGALGHRRHHHRAGQDFPERHDLS